MSRIDELIDSITGKQKLSKVAEQLGETDKSIRDQLGVSKKPGRDLDAGEIALGLAGAVIPAARLVKDQFDSAEAAKAVSDSSEALDAQIKDIEQMSPKNQYKALQALTGNLDELEKKLAPIDDVIRETVVAEYKKGFKTKIDKALRKHLSQFHAQAQFQFNTKADELANQLTLTPSGNIPAQVEAAMGQLAAWFPDKNRRAVAQAQLLQAAYDAAATGYRGREDRAGLRIALQSKEYKNNMSKERYQQLRLEAVFIALTMYSS